MSKRKMKLGGIYQIRNLINDKRYIGFTHKFNARWTDHKKKLNQNRHGNPHLQTAWNKYGSENFVFEILEVIKKCRRCRTPGRS